MLNSRGTTKTTSAVPQGVSFGTANAPNNNGACSVPFRCPNYGGHEKRHACVSTDDHFQLMQLAALNKDEGPSCATTKRPSLLRCLRAVDPVIRSLSKLERRGRSLRDLFTMLHDVRTRGVKAHGHKEKVHGFSSTTNNDWPNGGRANSSRRDTTGTTNRSKISICSSDCASRPNKCAFIHQPKKPMAFT
jgi:hypothetical protein